MSGDAPLEPPDTWHPIRLPNPEAEGGRPTSEAAADPPPAWAGERPLAALTPEERRAVERARDAGLVALAPPPTTEAPQRPVVLSPHPDDAVLSLGARLAAPSTRATVLDVFSRETWSPRPFYAERPELAARTILDEERAACRIVGADPRFLGLLDAPLRGEERVLGAEADPAAWRTGRAAEIVAEIAAALREAVRPDDDRVYVPMAVGGHVDHLLCLAAAASLVDDGTLPADRIRLYEDLPYAALPRPGGPPRPPLTALRAIGLEAAGPEVRTAAPHEAIAKSEALRAYRVQLREGIRRRVLAHGLAIGGGGGLLGERLWRCRRAVADERDAAEQPVADAGHRDQPCG